MRQPSRLPGRLDGAEGLLELAKVFGPEQVFDLIMLCRTHRGPGQDPAGEALAILGNQVVEQVAGANPAYTGLQARQTAAHKLGFHDGGSRTNFNKILAGGRNWRSKKKEQVDGRTDARPT